MHQVLTALVIVVALALTGCATKPAAEPAPGFVSESAPSPSSTPVATPSSPASAAMPTCLDLLTESQLALLDDPASDWDINDFTEGPAFAFTSLERMDAVGGTTCVFGEADTDNALAFGYATTDGVDLAELRQYFTDYGFVQTSADDGETYCRNSSLDEKMWCNVVAGGQWFMSTDLLWLPALQEEVAAFVASTP